MLVMKLQMEYQTKIIGTMEVRPPQPPFAPVGVDQQLQPPTLSLGTNFTIPLKYLV